MNIKTFVVDQKLDYLEHNGQDIYINKFYQIERTNSTMKFNTIPDACVDLQFTDMDGKPVVYACGSFLKSDISPTSQYRWCFGVRFNLGMYPKLVRGKMEKLIEGHEIIEGYSWLDNLANLICKADSFQKRIELFEGYFPFEVQLGGMNPMVAAIMRHIEKARGCISIAEIAAELQYNQRYMVRVFHKATGLTMKKYATIIQIQTAIRYLQEGRMDEIYEKLGYYDQSYFIKKFKQYTSMTPREYCNKLGRNIV